MRCSLKSTVVLTAGFTYTFWACDLAVNVGWAEPPLVADQATQQAQRLIQQLGASSFELREEAARQLGEIGIAALPALQEAANHSDLEIRYRARQLRDSIELIARDRALIEFLATGDPALGELLPGWSRFAPIVGADRGARKLFVEMHQAEPEIMRLVDRPGGELQSVVEQRSESLRSRRRQNRNERMSPATLSVFMFVMLDPACDLSVGAQSMTAAVIRQPQISAAINESDHSAIRRLMATWIAEADDVSPTHRISFAMDYSIDSGVVPALQVIRKGARGSHLQNAIQAIGKLGGPEHIGDLATLLNDSTTLSEKKWSDKLFSSQVRDVALAVMVHLSGQNPYDYGFTRLRLHRHQLFQQNTAGFASDKQRDKAISQWRLWARVQRAQALPIDATAIEGVAL